MCDDSHELHLTVARDSDHKVQFQRLLFGEVTRTTRFDSTRFGIGLCYCALSLHKNLSTARRLKMDRLKGKVALISGGARGQGAAEAKLFAAEGAKVIIGDVRDKLTRQTAAVINAQHRGNTVRAVHLDVTRAADWRGAVETCEREFGGLDILVNNAGIANMK